MLPRDTAVGVDIIGDAAVPFGVPGDESAVLPETSLYINLHKTAMYYIINQMKFQHLYLA